MLYAHGELFPDKDILFVNQAEIWRQKDKFNNKSHKQGNFPILTLVL